ncbi:hypothetical protein D3C73_1319450 [compost metagenome]
MPGFTYRVVVFTRVRIDQQRFVSQCGKLLQRRGHIFQRNAVNANRQHLWIRLQRCHDLGQRRPVAEVLTVAQGESEPGTQGWELFQQRQQRLQFAEGWQSLAGQ